MEKSGKGTLGTRVAPTKSRDNDSKFGLRIEYGEVFEKGGKKYRRLHLQANKNAQNPTIKAKAALNPHKVWSHADVQVEDEATDRVAADIGSSHIKNGSQPNRTNNSKDLSAQAE